MLPLFDQALDSRLETSPGYLETLAHTFCADGRTGFFEVETGPGQALVLFYLGGKMALALQVGPGGTQTLSITEIGQGWATASAGLRIVEAPGVALRTAWQALEWGPPAPPQNLTPAQLHELLAEMQNKALSGLVRLQSDDTDGFWLVEGGVRVGGEEIYATARGFSPGPTPQGGGSGAGRLSFFPQPPESPSGRMLQLRLAATSWFNATLEGYRNMAGQNLLLSLGYDINSLSRRKRLDFHLAGQALLDRNFFPQPQEACAAYQALARGISVHVSQVIGTGLTRRLFSQASQRLAPARQALLAQAGFQPESAL